MLDMKSCLKISYQGEVSFIVCDAGSNYERIIEQGKKQSFYNRINQTYSKLFTLPSHSLLRVSHTAVTARRAGADQRAGLRLRATTLGILHPTVPLPGVGLLSAHWLATITSCRRRACPATPSIYWWNKRAHKARCDSNRRGRGLCGSACASPGLFSRRATHEQSSLCYSTASSV